MQSSVGSGKQLFTIIPTMQLTEYFDAFNNRIVLKEADGMPFMRLPNGTPCLVANAYMVHLFQKGLSRRSSGGSLRQYAAEISHLIRFCYRNQIDFTQMDNNRFILFIRTLRAEKDPSDPDVQRRASNTLNAIGRRCLDFLDFVGRFNGEDDFVVNVVRGFKKTFYARDKNARGGYSESQSWHHQSFDTPGPKKKRGPISKENIKVLYDAIFAAGAERGTDRNRKVIQRRRIVMLRLLEMTGARIGEIAEIRVKDLEEAFAQSNPKLRLITLKGRKPKERFVPVLQQDLAVLKPYVRVTRTALIKETIGSQNDHGYLFVGERTGLPLSSRYMSNEIGLLRKAAGLSTGACAHMFRHRFITKLFVRLIEQYDYETKDEFRRALLDTQMLKQEVQQYTGHKLLSSLDHYIDLAFEEVADLSVVVDSVNLKAAYEAFDSLVEQLHRELEAGMPIAVYLEKYHELLELRVADVGRISTMAQDKNERS